MESESPNAGAVKGLTRNKARILPLHCRDKRTRKLFYRMLGYLNGAFVKKSNGRLPWMDWNHERFSKKTQRFYSVRHLERAFPRFQRWCSEYRFDRVNIGGRWRVRVSRELGVQAGVSGSQIANRLTLAIRAYVVKAGRARVDMEFCRKFSEISNLPLQGVETLWLQLKKIDGLKCRWRGTGRGRKFVVVDPERENLKTDPQTSPPVSISYGNDKIKTNAPEAQTRKDRPRASPATESASVGSGAAPQSTEPQTGLEHAGNLPRVLRSPPGFEPMQICGRFVSSLKLFALAKWLAVEPLKFAHSGRDRVVWRFAHSRNFAFRALRSGYASAAIVSAYRSGVERSHQDALDADRLPGGGYASTREPSATVVYAWSALVAADSRPPADRWQEFFDSPPRDKSEREKSSAARKARNSERKNLRGAGPAPAGRAPRMSARDAAEQLAELRAIVKARPRLEPVPDSAVKLGELADFLKTRGMTIPEFNAMPFPRRRWLLDRAAEWRDARDRRSVD